MARKKQGSFKMKGHTLPGINQKSETVNKKDGKSPSSAFQQKSSPNKILGAIAGAGMLAKGVGNLLGKNKEEKSKELLEGTGKTIEPVQGFKISGGEGGDAAGTTTPGTTMPEAGGGAAATNKPDEVLTMKSPNKKKLKTGTKTKIGGKLNEGTSPHQNL